MSLSKSLPGSLGVLLCLVSCLSAQHVTAPMLPYKDGDVSPKSGEGEDEELLVTNDGDSRRLDKRNLAWITFQAQGIDLAHASHANLSLNLSGLKKAGMLHVYALTAPVAKVEDKTGWEDIRFNPARPVASMRIDASMLDMIINLDVTAAIKPGPFHGLALVGDATLQAAFSARESGMPPMIQLRYPALTGPQGPKGEDGKDGIDGVDGRDRLAGPVGPVGPQGIPGETGATGPMGPMGPTGPQGIQGETGAIGPMGPQGIPGETGAIGPMGPMGPQGIQGETGAAGPMGPQGETGPMGPMGLTGPQGEAGPVGPQGPPGTSGAPTSWVESKDSLTTQKRVGIGTTNPQSKLHVVGDVTVSGQIRGATFGFGGMYQKDDCNVNTLVNPLTGGLTCPAGFTAYRIGRIYTPESGCGANQWICIK